MRNCILIGFMGAGKTTVGRLLAQKLHRSFLDTDQYLESCSGETIPEIFAREGEEGFRRRETQMLFELGGQTTEVVISCGGGLPLREENRQLLRQLGTVYWLWASPETVYERVRGDRSRPLLAGEDPYGTIVRLMQERQALYEQAADRKLCVDQKSAEELAEEIQRMEEHLQG